jgi:CubicO group peptidase (beta-lactamase class C family)
MTKPVTAAAVMKLVEQGRLSLQDPVARHIPAFAGVAVYDGGGADAPRTAPVTRLMTVQDLLAHTSGMAYGINATSVDTLVQRFEVFRASRTAAGMADTLATIPLLFEPGTAWNYGPGLEVAARVVEVVTGEPFDAFVEREILRPLRMHDTMWRVPPEAQQKLVTLYQRSGGSLQPVTGTWPLITALYAQDARLICGGCGLLSTAGDFLRFAQMLLNGGTLDGVRVLGEQAVRTLTSDVLDPSIPGIPDWMGPGYGHGLGVAVQVGPATETHPTAPGTFGWAGAASTWFWVDPENELILMVWAQHLPWGANAFGEHLKPLVYGALLR